MAGREFTDSDTETSPTVAIVNDSFGRRFFKGESPLGRRVTSVNATYEIVGVVRDAKYQDLRQGILSTMYIPWTQRADGQPAGYSYLLRAAAGDPMQLAPDLDRVVREADPGLRVRVARTYDALIERSIATERIMAALGGAFGLLALVVSALGIFGVLAFQVARRTHELGVRIALGASRANLRSLVVRDLVIVLGAGITIGTAGALAAAGLARTLLFGMTPSDPAAFVVAAATLAGAAILAAWLPARRASRVDPVIALRHE